MSNGYNPLHHNCLRHGCFNFLRRPKIEQFSDCFPRNINFGDVDGIVEMNSAFCLLEWKSNGAPLKTAQRLLFERLTSSDPRHVAFIVSGSAETMVIDKYTVIRDGKFKTFEPATLNDLKARIKSWADWVEQQAA